MITTHGLSHLGQAIQCWNFGSGVKKVLIIGGVHGDEIEGVAVCNEIIRRNLNSHDRLPNHIGLAVVPCVNPDGILLNSRANFRSVDLNRNLPTTNWRAQATDVRFQPGESAASEAETVTFMEILKSFKPSLVISVHSFKQSLLLFPNNSVNLPYKTMVEAMAKSMAIPIVDQMDYEIFGSLSRYGFETELPVLTVEVLRGVSDSGQVLRCADAICSLIDEL